MSQPKGFVESIIEGFSDANWISNFDEIKSTNGYVITLTSDAVSWKYTKQTIISPFAMEA